LFLEFMATLARSNCLCRCLQGVHAVLKVGSINTECMS
jgi:hypothetical protein